MSARKTTIQTCECGASNSDGAKTCWRCSRRLSLIPLPSVIPISMVAEAFARASGAAVRPYAAAHCSSSKTIRRLIARMGDLRRAFSPFAGVAP